MKPSLLLGIAAAALACVTHVVGQHTIAVVQARHLLPRWDLATHLGHGWVDYHFLATGQIHRLLWDLWMQGYWPPVLSLYQMPFYLVLGGSMTSGLRSGLVAFVLVGLAGSAVLWREWRYRAVLPASLFLALLMSSPFLLAYASVTMTETLGALAQLVVLLSYVRYRQDPGTRTARTFAISLTVVFFTKYNYFFLFAAPLVLYEWLEGTSGWGMARRLAALWRRTRRLLTSPTGAFVALYIVALLIILRSGGFDFQLLGRRVSVHSVGNTGHAVLYILLARLWYLQHRRRIDWARLASADPRVRHLLIWFVAPVAVWFASPYPNHIRDFANLVINRPLGTPTVASGIGAYMDALRTTYFYNDWVLAFIIAAFGIAALRYRRQPPLMQWMILAVPVQLVAIAVHQTRFPRFLLLTVVLLCLAAAAEAGRWAANSARGRMAAVALAPLVLASGVVAARSVVTEERFRVMAFEHYTDSAPLRAALATIHSGLGPDDRLAIVGHNNELSPGLFRWELGPPSGVPCFPSQIGGAGRLDLALATQVLLLTPAGAGVAPLDDASYYAAQRRAVLERVDRGEFALGREMALADLQVVLRLYRRTSPPAGQATCQA